MRYWTDYPIHELGDKPGVKAPIRRCEPLDYDGDKYCSVRVSGVITNFKSGYIYTKEGRCGEVPCITLKQLHSLPQQHIER